eukprot:TRINITY_DN3480_c0_g1_i3.p1 TRINITY_DN3480_c0_g1~~TRINITY_DN3480_c0_g1_i3.p1  ORF type:complete len:503 (-),score=99.30 TRINITY_DN3480_c0_g1_i3:146-1594(-)
MACAIAWISDTERLAKKLHEEHESSQVEAAATAEALAKVRARHKEVGSELMAALGKRKAMEQEISDAEHRLQSTKESMLRLEQQEAAITLAAVHNRSQKSLLLQCRGFLEQQAQLLQKQQEETRACQQEMSTAKQEASAAQQEMLAAKKAASAAQQEVSKMKVELDHLRHTLNVAKVAHDRQVDELHHRLKEADDDERTQNADKPQLQLDQQRSRDAAKHIHDDRSCDQTKDACAESVVTAHLPDCYQATIAAEVCHDKLHQDLQSSTVFKAPGEEQIPKAEGHGERVQVSTTAPAEAAIPAATSAATVKEAVPGTNRLQQCCRADVQECRPAPAEAARSCTVLKGPVPLLQPLGLSRMSQAPLGSALAPWRSASADPPAKCQRLSMTPELNENRCQECGNTKPTFLDASDNMRYCQGCWVAFYGKPPGSKSTGAVGPVNPAPRVDSRGACGGFECKYCGAILSRRDHLTRHINVNCKSRPR